MSLHSSYPNRVSADDIETAPNGLAGDEVPVAPLPDDKDWTWVLNERCGECNFDPGTVHRADFAERVRAAIPRWVEVLSRTDVTALPDPRTWSALEYGCHVRDVFTRFDERLRQMLDTADPTFANWDQDRTAIEQRYWEQDAAAVAAQLRAAGDAIAGTFDSVDAAQWQRPGRRTNGSQFTVESLGRYFLHDVTHHLRDVNA